MEKTRLEFEQVCYQKFGATVCLNWIVKNLLKVGVQ